MTDHMKIDHEVGKRITAAAECALLQAAYARNPESPLLRERLAGLLSFNDRFVETIALYEGVDLSGLGFTELQLLVHAHTALERPEDNARAADIATMAFDAADQGIQRASALAAQGKVLRRMGATDAAEHVLKQALIHNPHNKDACKRLASLHLDNGAPERVLDAMAQLDAQGVGHSRLFAAQTLALAQLGRIEAARAQDGWGRFAYRGTLAPPDGFADIASFNAALADELLTHPGLRYERYGTASEQTWRIDAPATGQAPRVRQLLDALIGTIDAHLATLESDGHPWLRARPGSGILHSWCVITESTGFETWHVHQFGWLSGVYYVQVPEGIATGTDAAGCIAFGVPEDIVGDDAAQAFGSTVVRPQGGTVMLFPSHCYHRTFPHGSAERRICVAFDIWPG
ncbi:MULTISPECIES: 2OG-Fe(II) oxygenase family protein [unclassified Sphingomonas]|uniref:2OG-Fe(II) oxygenase family protein n=1 Tax=unclassified Sphingomonas TaxID=196159 RepID=UPI000830614B|nr:MULTISPECIES: putative 2OG-Fe(II) oxygenase [unclassified Sphingomonas]